jgi:hypothetical protein
MEGIMKKKRLFVWITIAALALGGLTVNATTEYKEISQVELTDSEYNGKIYTYAVQKQYETTNQDAQVLFDEKVNGMELDTIAYDTVDTIYQTKVLTESKDYKDLLEKDESKLQQTITVNGETYELEDVTWSEEPNIEKLTYTVDYGYCTEEPEPSATYEYTYTSPVFQTENTVNLPFVRLEKGDTSWVDGFSATVTFKNLDGEIFTLGNHEFSYDPDNLSLTEADFTELVKMLGYDTSKYRLTSASWSGKAYQGNDNGELYRDAKAYGQQFAASYKALYADEVENGKIYTAHATYSCEVELSAQEAAPTYVMQAIGYYKKAASSMPVLISVGIVIFVLLVIVILYTISGKKKNVSSSPQSMDIPE